MKRNKLREGIKASSKLKKSFYQFLFEKHIDWAILLSCFFLMLPYIGSKNPYFLISRFLLFGSAIYLIVKYVLCWKELDSFKKIWEETSKKIISLIKEDKVEEVTSTTTKNKIEQFVITTKEILPELKLIAEKKISPQELQNKYPEQVSKLENILNEDKDLTSTVLGTAFLSLSMIQIMRNIPKVELNNYRRILYIIFITLLFFVLYTLEISIN